MTDLPAALAQLVWDERRSAELAELGHHPSAAARVVRVDRGHASLRAADGDLRVATDHLDAELAVGDWVALDDDGGIAAVLERRTLLERGACPTTRRSSPVVAANVDVVVVANALDHPFSARRLERFLLVAWESGAVPLVVLTKADACADLAAARRRGRGGRPGRAGAGAERPHRSRASTSCARDWPARRRSLLGRSGAGKSTLVNALVGEDVAATAEVRRDGKGRHTTTHRELHCSRAAAC